LAFRAEDNELLILNEPGTLYLVDFVAVGCKPCAEEAPDMERLGREFESPGRFRLVTVVFGWPSKELANRRKELNIEHLTLYADEGGVAAQALEVQGWPTKCLIRDGRVLLHRMGGGPGAYSIWREIIREHMKRRSKP
jgi:thiol-disulfide isomerase/thioredoxin